MNEPSIEDTENEQESRAQDEHSIWATDPYTQKIARRARNDVAAARKALIGAAATSDDPNIREAWGRYEVCMGVLAFFDNAGGK